MNTRLLLATATFVAALGLTSCHKAETTNDTTVVENGTSNDMMAANDMAAANDMMANDATANDMDSGADENQHLIDPHADASAPTNAH